MLPARTVNPVIYLPIEHRSREFDAKLAVGVNLVRSGLAVVIGQQWAMLDGLDQKMLPPGVVLFKSQNKIHHRAMAMARARGHIVVSLEEESLALTTSEAVVRNCPRDTYGLVDILLTTGKVERQIHVEQGCDPQKLFVTGNPRIDILKPLFRPLFQETIDALHGRFGQYVLINTNFGIKNSKWGSVEAVRKIEIGAGALDPADPESVRRFEQLVAFEEKNSQALFEMVSRLSATYPERAFVLRPHPGEYLPKVAQQYESMRNVHVLYEGSHIPWTMGCDLLLHSSCTTGLEAAIAGTRAFSLVTLDTWTSRAFLSNQVNSVFSSIDAILEAAQDFLAGRPIAEPPQLSSFDHYIHNIEGALSIDVITEVLCSLPYAPGGLKFIPIPPAKRHPYQVEKCSISVGEMKEAVKRISRIYTLSANGEPSIHPMGDSIFLLSPPRLATTKEKATSQVRL